MDGIHSHPFSPLSTSTNAHTTSELRFSQSPTAQPHSKRYSEPSPSRQRRLLQNRNAKFPAKKLSLSNLGSRFSQLIHGNEEQEATFTPSRNQENAPLRSQESQNDIKRHSSGSSLGILDELSNTGLNGKARRNGRISIHEDIPTPERPLLERSPFSSPAIYQDSVSQGVSPIGFDHIQDSLGNMRLREISGNERRHLSSVTSAKKRKSVPLRSDFDTQDYIEHIENELQTAKNEMFSPTTNKSLRDQLKSACCENERLKQEMIDLRNIFEAEVKRTIEQKAEMEVELKRKVRDLEEEAEQKEATIRDLELQHDERRLEGNTIDALKAAIEKLEQDKLTLEDENRSINKRNEVLSEILVMSPTKTQACELRSPTRERRGAGRPISMILPRNPSSPNGRSVNYPASAAVSPSLSACGAFFGLGRSRATSPHSVVCGLGLSGEGLTSTNLAENSGSEFTGQGYFDHPAGNKQRSRRSTLQSHASVSDTASIVSKSSSPLDHALQRIPTKRKPRKFMSGSTQLKPLLLPSMNGDSMSLSSSSAAAHSPQIGGLRRFSQESIVSSAHSLFQFGEPFSNSRRCQPEESKLKRGKRQRSNDSVAEYQNLEDAIAGNVTPATDVPSDDESISISLTSDAIVSDANNGQCHLTGIRTAAGTLQYARIHGENGKTGFLLPTEQFLESSPVYLSNEVQPPSGFDLNALSQLHLPAPDYDALPSSRSDVDDSMLTEVPQPLFSANYHSNHTKHNSVDTSSCLHHRHGKHEMALFQFPISNPSDDVTTRDRMAPDIRSRSSFDLQTITKTKTPPFSVAQEGESGTRSDLPQRSSLRATSSSLKARNIVDLLCSGKLGAKPLAALTIKTIFTTISRCTGHIQDFRRDPLALARRLIANAWFSNWKRVGKLSWWVLGLFVSSGGESQLKMWDWENFDGEEIARRACVEHEGQNHTSTGHMQHRLAIQESISPPGVVHDDNTTIQVREKAGWGKSVFLWGKFSMAIMLAIGGAVVKGPGEMLKEIDTQKRLSSNTLSDLGDSVQKGVGKAKCGETIACSYLNDTRPPYFNSSYCRRPESSWSPGLNKYHTKPQTIDTDHVDIGARRLQYRGLVDEDDTLRAVRSSRKHVTDYFPLDSTTHTDFVTRPMFNRPQGFSSLSNMNMSVVGNGIEQWLSSPDLANSENDCSLQMRQH